MDALAVGHLLSLGLWGGLVLAEVVIEAGALDQRVAARLHHRLDLLLKVPLLCAVLVTGAALASRVPMTPLLVAKIAAGLLAASATPPCSRRAPT